MLLFCRRRLGRGVNTRLRTDPFPSLRAILHRPGGGATRRRRPLRPLSARPVVVSSGTATIREKPSAGEWRRGKSRAQHAGLLRIVLTSSSSRAHTHTRKHTRDASSSFAAVRSRTLRWLLVLARVRPPIRQPESHFVSRRTAIGAHADRHLPVPDRNIKKTMLQKISFPQKMCQRGLHGASKKLDSLIRVNHAGELGADRIYAGQMAVLGNTSVGPKIKAMWEQEKLHRQKFEELIIARRVRPSLLYPLWHCAGYVLGAGTAFMGPKAAMACTVAVETVIVDHYNEQLRDLMEDSKSDPELLETIKKFRDEEQEHHDCGIEHGAEQTPFYNALTQVIKTGCKVAIEVAKKV